MSDEIVKCDGCGEAARRREDRLCPDHWFFIESVNAHDAKIVYVVWACSEKCRDGLWQRGPGPVVKLVKRRHTKGGAS